MATLNSCDRDHMTCSVKNINYLILSIKFAEPCLRWRISGRGPAYYSHGFPCHPHRSIFSIPIPATGSYIPSLLPLQAQKLTIVDIRKLMVMCSEGGKWRRRMTQDIKPFDYSE